MKYIRKVVTHLPTGKEWFTKAVENSEMTDSIFAKWQEGVITGRTAALTLQCEMGDGSTQLIGFSQNILKDCVVTIETYGK